MKTISAPRQGGRSPASAPLVVDRQLGDRARRLDAGHAGHADVEEDDVGPVLLGQLHRFGAVLRLGDDLELGPDLGQARAELFAQQPFVVGDHGGVGRRRGLTRWRDCPSRRSAQGAEVGGDVAGIALVDAHVRHRRVGSTCCGSRIQRTSCSGVLASWPAIRPRRRDARRAADRRAPASRSRRGCGGRRCRRTASARRGRVPRVGGRRGRAPRSAPSSAGLAERLASAERRPASATAGAAGRRPRPQVVVGHAVLPGRHAAHLDAVAASPSTARAACQRCARVDQRAGQRLHAAADLALRHAGAAVALHALVAIAERAARDLRRVVEAGGATMPRAWRRIDCWPTSSSSE